MPARSPGTQSTPTPSAEARCDVVEISGIVEAVNVAHCNAGRETVLLEAEDWHWTANTVMQAVADLENRLHPLLQRTDWHGVHALLGVTLVQPVVLSIECAATLSYDLAMLQEIDWGLGEDQLALRTAERLRSQWRVHRVLIQHANPCRLILTRRQWERAILRHRTANNIVAITD